MALLRTHWRFFLILASLLGALVGWYAWPAPTETALFAPVKHGAFTVLVNATGELRASQFVEITGPEQAGGAGIFQTKIASLVPEGSLVQAGDVIAELDRTSLATKLNDVRLNVQKGQADFTSAQLDSALNLAQAREDVRTAQYSLEEKTLLKEQNQYEAPSVKRQAEMDYEKAQRALDQAKQSLATKTKQAIAKLSSVGADLSRQQNQLSALQEVMGAFTIRAPAPGMVIYIREWNGKKKGVGSAWQSWAPGVATLPDLTQMESDVYINEVDIRKVAVGQPVQITLDSDPSKHLTGVVTQVANVGEQRPNQDAKVFEVKIQVVKPDTALRPGMTTANAIETTVLANVLSVPLEAVVNEGGFSYVYKKAGRSIIKQMIEPGPSNENELVVQRGLTQDDRVLLSLPSDQTGIKTERIPGLKPWVAPAPAADTVPRVPLARPVSKATVTQRSQPKEPTR